MNVPSCPAGQYFVQPVPISDTVLPTGTAYPTQFTDAYERLAPTDASAAAAVQKVAKDLAGGTRLGQSFGFARGSAERRYRNLLRDLLREGFGYDWAQVLAPLDLGGTARFLSERAYIQARLGGQKAVVAEQTALRTRLNGLLCWGRALAVEAERARDHRDAPAVIRATQALLARAEARLDVPGSYWAASQAKEARLLGAALEERLRALVPPRATGSARAVSRGTRAA